MKSLDEILNIIKSEGTNIRELSKNSGVNYGVLDRVKRGQSLKVPDFLKLQNYFLSKTENEIPDPIVSDNPISYQAKRLALKNQVIKNPVKFYEVDFSAGNGVDFIDDIQSIQPAYVMDVPEFNGCTAFRSFGKSMEPLIDAGAILFATKDDSWRDYIEYGQIYGIVCNNRRRFLKYIQKSEKNGYILLRSENKEFDSFDLPLNAVKSIWLINGWINKRV